MKPTADFLRVICLLVTVLLCTGPMAHGETGPIKIGFVADFSSVSRPYTENAFKVAQFAVAEFNAQGGVLGRPVQMIHRDGANDPALHYRHVVDLVRKENIVAVFGGASSPCVLKASAACKELKIPYLVSMGNSQSLVVENGHPYVFLLEPNTRMESMGFSIFVSLMPWKRYAWFGPDYSWGRDVMGFFKQYFEDIGAPITWTAEIWHPLGAREYKAAIERIIASQPEALVVATWGKIYGTSFSRPMPRIYLKKWRHSAGFPSSRNKETGSFPKVFGRFPGGLSPIWPKSIHKPGLSLRNSIKNIILIPSNFQSVVTIHSLRGGRPCKKPDQWNRPPWPRRSRGCRSQVCAVTAIFGPLMVKWTAPRFSAD